MISAVATQNKKSFSPCISQLQKVEIFYLIFISCESTDLSTAKNPPIHNFPFVVHESCKKTWGDSGAPYCLLSGKTRMVSRYGLWGYLGGKEQQQFRVI